MYHDILVLYNLYLFNYKKNVVETDRMNDLKCIINGEHVMRHAMVFGVLYRGLSCKPNIYVS